jgi:hypothetical protein
LKSVRDRITNLRDALNDAIRVYAFTRWSHEIVYMQQPRYAIDAEELKLALNLMGPCATRVHAFHTPVDGKTLPRYDKIREYYTTHKINSASGQEARSDIEHIITDDLISCYGPGIGQEIKAKPLIIPDILVSAHYDPDHETLHISSRFERDPICVDYSVFVRERSPGPWHHVPLMRPPAGTPFD